MPVKYSLPRWGDGWVPTAMQSVQLPEWAVRALATKRRIDRSAGGVANAAQFKRLTPLDEA